MTDGAGQVRPLALALSVVVSAALLIAFTASVEPMASLCARVLVPALVALPVLLAAFATGAFAQGLSRRLLGAGAPAVDAITGAEAVLFTLVTGVPLFGCVCFVVGALSLSVAAMAGVLLVPAAAGLFLCARGLRAAREPRSWPFAGPALWLCLASFGLALCIAQLPPFTLDELAYHLAVPAAYLAEGRIVELPLNSQSYFPHGVEASALVTMTLAGPVGAIAHHFVVLATAVASLALLALFVARRGSALAAGMAAMAVGTTPALVLVAGTSWVECPLVGISVSTLVALDAAVQARAQRGTLAAVAVAVAAGLVCKYTYLAVAAALFVAALLALRRVNECALLLRAGLVGTLLGCTFFVRNLFWTGNPFSPFLDAVAPNVAAFHGGDGPLATALSFLYAPGMADESLGASLFALVCVFVACFAALHGERFLRVAATLTAVIAVLAMVLGAAGRLLVPFLTLTAMVACIGLARGAAPDGRGFRTLRVVLTLTCLVQLTFILSATDSYRPFSVLARGTTDAEFVRGMSKTFAPIRFIDGQLPERSKTLVIGVQELFWFRHRVHGGGNFDGPRVARYLHASTPEALGDRLRADGFSHVAIYQTNMIVGAHPVSGRAAEGVVVLDTAQASLLRSFLARHAQKLGSGEGATVFALKGT